MALGRPLPAPSPADEPTPRPHRAPPERSGGGSRLPAAFLLLCAVCGALLGGLLFLAFLPTLFADQARPIELQQAPLRVAPGSPPQASLPTPQELGADGFVVEVAPPNLRKLQVRCPSGVFEATGLLVATVPEPGACTVTALFQDRSRATAVIDPAEAGARYLCFVDGGSTCQKRDDSDAVLSSP
ncbi:MAG: hypothetical protein ABIO70_27150 [Pseudomonadota bacterium]